MKKMGSKRLSPPLVLYGFLTLVIAYFTYFRNYSQPANLFWDENYYLASTQKYLDRVMFMEPHPPLGKMFIALGEYLFSPNEQIDREFFLTTDYVKDIPLGYSFRGVRFFPTLLATLASVVFFFILYQISKSPNLAFLFSSFYLFENAIIVTSRGAMLEGIQIFFVLLSLWYFLVLVDRARLSVGNYWWLGILSGLAVSVKLNSLLLVFVFPALFFSEESYRDFARALKRFLFKDGVVGRLAVIVKDFILKSIAFLLGGSLVFVGAYYLHFTLGKKVVDDRYYQASEEYRQLLKTGKTNGLVPFYFALRDNLKFIPHYEKGVPKYNACKKGENGSLPFTWPVGNKSINYRWERDGEAVRYLYLQGNPLIWFTGLVGIVLAFSLIIAKVLFGLPITNKRLFLLIKAFSLLYLVYMIAMARLKRVLYLYHYLIPLLISLLLAFLLINYLFEEKIKAKNRGWYLGACLFVVLVVLTYHFFAPLTYYLPLTTEAFRARQWFTFWKLEPIR